MKNIRTGTHKFLAAAVIGLFLLQGCGENSSDSGNNTPQKETGNRLAENQKQARAYRDSLEQAFEKKNGLTEQPDTAGNILVPETGHLGGYYVVSKGEYLAQIALRIYGNSEKWYDIFAANEGYIDNYDKIYPGQRLQLPVEKE